VLTAVVAVATLTAAVPSSVPTERPILAASPVVLTAVDAETTQTGRPESAMPLTLAEGRIRFVPPAGFTPLTAGEIAAKYPSSGLSHAVGNARRTTTIGYDLLTMQAPTGDLEEARKAFAASYETLPTLKWVVNRVGRVGRRDWVELEFTVIKNKQLAHNIALVSVYDGRILLFSFNSTATEFPDVERALRASIATIATTP
jgi:hypothetical protein